MKVLVYCENDREGRRFFPPKSDIAVGYRRYKDYGKEKADEILVIDEKKIKDK